MIPNNRNFIYQEILVAEYWTKKTTWKIRWYCWDYKGNMHGGIEDDLEIAKIKAERIWNENAPQSKQSAPTTVLQDVRKASAA